MKDTDIDRFIASLKSASFTHRERLRDIRLLLTSVATIARSQPVTAQKVSALIRLGDRVVRQAEPLPNRERVLPALLDLLAEAAVKLAEACMVAGAPNLAVDVYESLANWYFKTADLSSIHLNRYRVAELRRPALFWLMKADHAKLRAPTINLSAIRGAVFEGTFTGEEPHAHEWALQSTESVIAASIPAKVPSHDYWFTASPQDKPLRNLPSPQEGVFSFQPSAKAKDLDFVPTSPIERVTSIGAPPEDEYALALAEPQKSYQFRFLTRSPQKERPILWTKEQDL